jgi:hypothetical protein
MKSLSLLEQLQIHPIWPAYVVDDADDDTVATGDYVSMKDYESLLILIAFGDGTATSGDIDIELYQSTDTSNSLSDAKALDVCETGRIFSKVNATDLSAVGAWTKETQATADEIYDDEASGEKLGMIAIEIKASDLDADNGFTAVRCDLDTVSSAKLVCGLYILGNPRINAAPDLMPSAL